MSQEKVDRYKESKKTRKQDAEKKKRKDLIRRIATIAVICVLAAALLTGIGVTIGNYISKKSSEHPYASSDFMLEDYVNIQGTSAEAGE